MVETCLSSGGGFGVVLISSGREVGEPAVPHPVGTLARLTAVERLPDGRFNIEVVGQQRFHILSLHTDQPYLSGTVEDFPLAGASERGARLAARTLIPWLYRYLNMLGEKADTRFDRSQLPKDPASIGYLAGIVVQIPMPEKQRLLSIASAAELLDRERAILRRETALLRVILDRDQTANSGIFSPN
jgi:Lon protease-like protein